MIDTPEQLADAIIPISAWVNRQPDRYAALCFVLVFLFRGCKLPLEDKQEVLSDISDILDNLPPSSRSRVPFIQRNKPGRDIDS